VRLQFESEDGPVTLQIEKQDGALHVTLPDNSAITVHAEQIQGDIILLESEGVRTRIPFYRDQDRIEFAYRGSVYSFTPYTPHSPDSSRGKHSTGELKAPMVGTVSGLLVREGEKVKSYQPILVIEAMKVLATLEAPFAGTITLRVSKGQQVQHGQILAEVITIDEAANAAKA
jgi:acetyl/propionyl-CoA carboxylase alpha subunit